MSRPPRPAPPAYVDTPAGLFSAAGVHYHTTEALLRDFAGDVPARVPLDALVRAADAWVGAPRVAAMGVLLAALFVLMPAWAAVAGVVAWLALAIGGPALASPSLAGVWRAGASVAAQGAAYAVGLSVLAAQGRTDAVIAGLIGFVALRLGLVDRMLAPLVAPAVRHLYTLPPADQTLRSVVVRTAIRLGIPLPTTAPMEARVRDFWQRRRDA